MKKILILMLSCLMLSCTLLTGCSTAEIKDFFKPVTDVIVPGIESIFPGQTETPDEPVLPEEPEEPEVPEPVTSFTFDIVRGDTYKYYPTLKGTVCLDFQATNFSLFCNDVRYQIVPYSTTIISGKYIYFFDQKVNMNDIDDGKYKVYITAYYGEKAVVTDSIQLIVEQKFVSTGTHLEIHPSYDNWWTPNA